MSAIQGTVVEVLQNDLLMLERCDVCGAVGLSCRTRRGHRRHRHRGRRGVWLSGVRFTTCEGGVGEAFDVKAAFRG